MNSLLRADFQLQVRLGLRFRRQKVRFQTKSQKINHLGIAFLKNCDLKMKKITFLNRKQLGAFLKTRNFKR